MKVLLATFVFLSLAIPRAAFAQSDAPAPQPPLADSLQGPASEAYTSAKLLLNNKDFAGALAKYRQAYELSKDPRLLFDMAICERDLRWYAAMQGLLAQYEREAGPGISPQEKAMVDDALAAIQNLIGSVNLTASEAGATVSIDGEPVGTTPLARPIVLDLGKHKVVVTAPGFETLEQTVDIAGGSQTDLALTLTPQVLQAHLVVSSDADATVSVDGQVVGNERFDGPLVPGIHEVHVSEDDHVPYTAHIELRDGETRTMQVTLEREHHGSILPWIVGGAVVVAAGAIVGGYFLFKSPDSGPVLPPGALGTVTFQ